MDTRLRDLAWRRRDELGMLALLALGQLVAWTVPPGGDTLLHGSRLWNAAVLASTTVPLAWRRRAPLGAVVASSLAQGGSHLLARHGIEFLGFVPMLLLTVSAGWYLRGRNAWLALGVALAGTAAVEVVEPTLRQPEKLMDALWYAVPWGLLRALHAREDGVRRLAGELAVREATEEVRRREAVAAERARIARDLHDVVAHATSVMVIQVGAARMRHEAGEVDIGPQLAAAEQTGRQAIADLRRLLDVLRTWPEPPGGEAPPGPQPPQPRLGELAGLVDSYRLAGLRVDIHADVPADLPLGLQVSVYRIVQEALTNSLRYGAGRPATVTVTSRGRELRVDVTDAGDPANTTTAGVAGTGQGLLGMAERVGLLGGSLQAGPNERGGWSVVACLPLEHAGVPA